MTSSRRLSQAVRKSRPSRTSSSRAKVYIAIPPAEGWPRFNGSNWKDMGLRNKK